MTQHNLSAAETQDSGEISKIFRAAEKCMSLRWPFVIYMYPGSCITGFMADRYDADDSRMPEKESDCFMVSFFNDHSSHVIIKGDFTADEILDDSLDYDIPGPQPEIHPIAESTPRILHKAQVFSIINDLKSSGVKNNGKVVLSRIVALTSDRGPLTVARDYFAKTPDAFRAIYYHPSTGIWITATPETLVDYRLPEGVIHTMALAGTRPAGTSGEWDKKNQREQQMVMKAICNGFMEEGIGVEVSEVYTRNAGNIEHLCQDITTTTFVNPSQLGTLMDTINPTPAVAGYPRSMALETIDRLETHFRHCYAGWLGVDREMSGDFFVNLRCAMVEPVEHLDEATGKTVSRYLYNVYVGGGILMSSDPDLEWEETTLKSLPLCKAIDPDYVPQE